jgi:biotin carboxylase
MSNQTRPLTVLCLASYYKGVDFMRACKELGCRVLLLTSKSLENENWPHESLDGIYYMDEREPDWDVKNLIKGVSYLARTEKLDRIVPLDDFDLEKAAALREHLRVPGMGDTRTRFFRDKLSMRLQAREAGILVPDFVHVLNHQQIDEYTQRVPPPWALKPRMQASAVGIRKVQSAQQLWQEIETLGEEQSDHLLERFVPGDIYHVDSIVFDKQVVFARVSRYMATPWEVTHHGGIFRSHTAPFASADDVELQRLNRELMRALGLLRGVSHTEFIKAAEDGRFYFLETSARVGGAHLAEMVEASSGINLWREWAKIESLAAGESYTLPKVRNDYSGIIISLAKQEYPDTSAYKNPEIVWRLNKRHHAGLIVQSPSLERVIALLDDYANRFKDDFYANMPAPDKPTS